MLKTAADYVILNRIPARNLLSSGVCVRLSEVGVLPKRWTDRAEFWHGDFRRSILHCVIIIIIIIIIIILFIFLFFVIFIFF